MTNPILISDISLDTTCDVGPAHSRWSRPRGAMATHDAASAAPSALMFAAQAASLLAGQIWALILASPS